MSAADDARDVLAVHHEEGCGGPCGACWYDWPCASVRLARVVLALAEPTASDEAVERARLDALTATIAAAITEQAAVWHEMFDGGEGLVVGVPDAAFVAARVRLSAAASPADRALTAAEEAGR